MSGRSKSMVPSGMKLSSSASGPGDAVFPERQVELPHRAPAISCVEHGLAVECFARDRTFQRDVRFRIGEIGLAGGTEFEILDIARGNRHLVAGDRQADIGCRQRAVGSGGEGDGAVRLLGQRRNIGQRALHVGIDLVAGYANGAAAGQAAGLQASELAETLPSVSRSRLVESASFSPSSGRTLAGSAADSTSALRSSLIAPSASETDPANPPSIASLLQHALGDRQSIGRQLP